MQGNQGCFQESANVLAMSRKLKHDTKTDLYLNKFYCALMPHLKKKKKSRNIPSRRRTGTTCCSVLTNTPPTSGTDTTNTGKNINVESTESVISKSFGVTVVPVKPLKFK